MAAASLSYTVKIASTDSELEGILKLQSLNLKNNVKQPEREKEGFVTLQHTMELLQYMGDFMGQVIAVDEKSGEVVGYALAKPLELQNKFPLLKNLVGKVSLLEYNKQPLVEDEYYTIGQVCVAQGFRGTGVFRALYEKHKEVFSVNYKYCITVVSTSNPRSLRAHEKAGFQVIHKFEDPLDAWCIILLDLRQ